MAMLTASIHQIGVAGLLLRQWYHLIGKPQIYTRLVVLVLALFGNFWLQTLKVWLSVALYNGVRLHAGSIGAFYFSTSTDTTFDYGGLLLLHRWRIFGAINKASGGVFRGWSTALFTDGVRGEWLEHKLDIP